MLDAIEDYNVGHDAGDVHGIHQQRANPGGVQDIPCKEEVGGHVGDDTKQQVPAIGQRVRCSHGQVYSRGSHHQPAHRHCLG